MVVGLVVVNTVVGRWLVAVGPVGDVEPRPVVVESPVEGVVVTPVGGVDPFPVEVVTPVGFDGWCRTQQSGQRRQRLLSGPCGGSLPPIGVVEPPVGVVEPPDGLTTTPTDLRIEADVIGRAATADIRCVRAAVRLHDNDRATIAIGAPYPATDARWRIVLTLAIEQMAV